MVKKIKWWKIECSEYFSNDTKKYIKNVNHNYNTQLNEGFHFLKTELASKSISWSIAVLRFNEPDTYFEVLESVLQIGIAIGSQYYSFKMDSIKRSPKMVKRINL